MKNIIRLAKNSLVVALTGLALGCVVAPPHEGYYDGEHHRYYHENSWHQCGEHDGYCH